MASITDFNTFVQALNTIQRTGPLFHMIKDLSNGVHSVSDTLRFLNNKKKPFVGADNITWNIINAKQRGTNFKGSTSLSTATQEFLGSGLLPRAYYQSHAAYNLTDIIQNSGSKDMMVDYVMACLDQAVKAIGHGLSLDLFGNGTTDANGDVAGGLAAPIAPIIGFQAAIEPDGTPSNTYAGIARSATTTYFNSNYVNAGSIAGVTLEKFHQLMSLCSRLTMGGDKVDLIVLPINAYRQVWLEAKAESALQPSKMAMDLGLPESFSFAGATVIPEKYMSATTDGGLLDTGLTFGLFLNSDDIMWAVDPKQDGRVGATLEALDQAGFVQRIYWSGQLVVKTPPKHGTIYWS